MLNPPTPAAPLVDRLLQKAVDVGWWEPSSTGRFWPGRIWLRFWRNPKNLVNRTFLNLLLSSQETRLQAYQQGVEDGHRATLAGLRPSTPQRAMPVVWN